MIAYGTILVYALPSGKKYIKKLQEGQDWHTSNGVLDALTVHQAQLGAVLTTSLGMPVRIEEATLFDKLMGIKRQTQIIYPKDLAYICLRLGAGPGRVIAEAGCGSGGLTTALSWFCGESGQVISQDNREEFVRLARRNLDWAGLGKNVELHVQDAASGFVAKNADALFLDMREPWHYLSQAASALRSGAILGFLLPTVNQISELLTAMENAPFAETEVSEILIRGWKALPDRLRPQDRMCAHTSFLVFSRKQEPSPEFDNYLPRDTRERKQDAAKEARRQNSAGEFSGY